MSEMLMDKIDRCGQTSGNIWLCNLGGTEDRGSLAVHFVVLINACVLDPLLATGELVEEDGLRPPNSNTNK
jgi:hypothetical protein